MSTYSFKGIILFISHFIYVRRLGNEVIQALLLVAWNTVALHVIRNAAHTLSAEDYLFEVFAVRNSAHVSQYVSELTQKSQTSLRCTSSLHVLFSLLWITALKKLPF